jgi:brefeldin A-inhibited guanine nucleotide-exchange protein
MRSKLLSLHLIHIIVNSHFGIFFTLAPSLFPTSADGPPYFALAIKQFFCLALSRNSASVIPQVFDTAMDIFGKALVGLRTVLKVRKDVGNEFLERAWGYIYGDRYSDHRGAIYYYISSTFICFVDSRKGTRRSRE